MAFNISMVTSTDRAMVMGHTYQLVVIELRANRRVHEPPGGSTDSSSTHVATNSHVTEEQPARDEGFTISDEVDPQKLDGNQSLRQTQSGSQEDTGEGEYSPYDLTNVGGDEVADELLHVAVDGTTFLNS
ncbi:hypothetical protein B566_EDAN017712 [Ephemera danica]|nr:hypothetical protein B566_EDAN019177 [Ephemera danica]KAF4529282.1 hypothetical protein B566_EDAN017712 [Ephemera danica]